MEKVFLCSHFNGVTEAFGKFINYEFANKSVAFIHTASAVEEYTGYVDEARAFFNEKKVIVKDVDVSSLSNQELDTILKASDWIYVAGGNSFYLLQELKKINADTLLRDYILQGKVYVGESAGAIILAENIEYIKIMDDAAVATELQDYTGLAVTNFFILPHLLEVPFEVTAIKTYEQYKDTVNLFPISNSQAIIIDDGTMTLEQG